MIGLKFREVGILANIRDDRLGQEGRQGLDELGWKSWPATVVSGR
jgi:hypothetical protein